MISRGICGAGMALYPAWVLLAVASAVWLGAASAAGGESQLQIATGDTAVTAKDGDQVVLEYLYGGVPFKPYVRQFPSPGGLNVLRDQVADHIHHHALMYAIKVDGVNFWEEVANCGKELHKSFSNVKSVSAGGLSSATLTEQLEWVGADAKPLMQETRQLTVYRSPDLGASLLTWRARLSPAEGRPEIKLGGNHYHGLGMRFLACMDKVGEFFTPEGKIGGEAVRGDEKLTKGTWCAYAAEANGKPVTAVMFDHPNNPREVLWFTMSAPFAYMSATMNLHREVLPVNA
ncbi:MAG: PmoA family protein, partial [Planctomycetota bacterium]|nr:PmoA family protein [Planctomycetota bacterium]